MLVLKEREKVKKRMGRRDRKELSMGFHLFY